MHNTAITDFSRVRRSLDVFGRSGGGLNRVWEQNSCTWVHSCITSDTGNNQMFLQISFHHGWKLEFYFRERKCFPPKTPPR